MRFLSFVFLILLVAGCKGEPRKSNSLASIVDSSSRVCDINASLSFSYDPSTYDEPKFRYADNGKDYSEPLDLKKGMSSVGGLPNSEKSPPSSSIAVTINLMTIKDRTPKSHLWIEIPPKDLKKNNPINEYWEIDRIKPYFDFGVAPFLATDDSRITKPDWSTGVATTLDWHPWGEYDLDPTIGFHGALLNQNAKDTFEPGLGGNISLLRGWVQFGVGHNFSSNGTYYFVGINLLNAAKLANSGNIK